MIFSVSFIYFDFKAKLLFWFIESIYLILITFMINFIISWFLLLRWFSLIEKHNDWILFSLTLNDLRRAQLKLIVAANRLIVITMIIVIHSFILSALHVTFDEFIIYEFIWSLFILRPALSGSYLFIIINY